MPTYKLIFFFDGQKQGWSETWYEQASSLSQAESDLSTLAQARADMLCPPNRIESIRASDVSIKGDSLVSFFGWSPKNPDVLNLTRDQQGAAVLVRAVAGVGLYRRMMWLRGIPDDWIQFDNAGKPVASAPANKALGLFEAALTAAKWQLRVIEKQTANAVLTPITGFAQSAVPGYTTVTAPGTPFGNGSSVRIHGAKNNTTFNPNGVWNVFNYAGNTFDIPLTWPTPAPIWAAFGTVQWRFINYVNVDSLNIERADFRKTGRAFFVQRGRRLVHKK